MTNNLPWTGQVNQFFQCQVIFGSSDRCRFAQGDHFNPEAARAASRILTDDSDSSEEEVVPLGCGAAARGGGSC